MLNNNNTLREYKKKCKNNKTYKKNLSQLLEEITYEQKYVNKNLNDYYDEQMDNLERYHFKIRLASFNNKVNYSRYLKKKITRTN